MWLPVSSILPSADRATRLMTSFGVLKGPNCLTVATSQTMRGTLDAVVLAGGGKELAVARKLQRHRPGATLVVQLCQLLARAHVPDDNAAAITAAGQPFAIGREGEHVGAEVIALDVAKFLAAGDVPETDAAEIAAGGPDLAVGRERRAAGVAAITKVRRSQPRQRAGRKGVAITIDARRSARRSPARPPCPLR